jgi:hypothetical protein
MKTKNNVQKAILRSAAVIISFVLISFTVSAQEFWKNLIEHSSFNEIAIAMTETSDKTNVPAEAKNEAHFSLYTEEAEDEALVLENWMFNDSYFGITAFQFEEETENPLEIENWMINDSFYETGNSTEEPLKLESWMTSDKFWNS